MAGSLSNTNRTEQTSKNGKNGNNHNKGTNGTRTQPIYGTSSVDNGAGWYKDAVIYEVHVRAFLDSNGDGVGDFPGLTEKLDYLQDLGVTAVWLLPFYSSPLRDDGYDIAGYKSVHPAYGTLADFKRFLDQAHQRGLRVITELVLNHTSDQHPWFQRARHAQPGSPERDFYLWSDTPDRLDEARVIFKDYEASNWSWDPVAQAYYWHRFYSHQPDLNFRNPRVQAAILDVVDFWLDMGVDGLRLDAVPYLYEREGTTSENLHETHDFLKKLRAFVDERYPGRMLLAEANQWPEEAAAYFGQGDECHMAFHFPLMPRLFMSIRREDRFPIIDIMAQTPEIPDGAQWALFLRNHDELTLEMVTDEERLYMYRVYAERLEARVNLGICRRLAPLLRNDRRRIELMYGLLFSLPGTPIIYYGDEIGMGDNIYLGDRNGVRTPMQWSTDRNAGFSRANPQQLYLPLIVDHEYHHESVQVEAQQSNANSLLQWTRRLIALRKRFHVFGRGSIEFLHPENRKVLAFTRTYGDERVLVVANLSRFAQHVELDLSPYQGMAPVELFGHVDFPPIGELPYFLTMGPHAFYWFSLQPAPVQHLSAQAAGCAGEREIPLVTTANGWESLLVGKSRDALADVLLEYLCGCRWFHGEHYRMLSAQVIDAVPLQAGSKTAYMCLIRVDYAHRDPETYTLPMAFASEQEARNLVEQRSPAVIARVGKYMEGEIAETATDGVLYDAMWDAAFVRSLAGMIAQGERCQGQGGSLVQGIQGAVEPGAEVSTGEAEAPYIVPGDLNNTSVVFGDQLILKLFRSVDSGTNPEVEISDYLTRCGFKHAAPLVGWLQIRQQQGQAIALASLERFVPNQGTAWDLAQAALVPYFERLRSTGEPVPGGSLSAHTLLPLAAQEPDAGARRLLGDFLDAASLLGRRTAELHSALMSNTGDQEFRPEPFTSYHLRSLYQSARRQTAEAMYALRRHLDTLPAVVQAGAQAILGAEDQVMQRLRSILECRIMAVGGRYHGDYRLSQVLWSGGDFVVVDFEGEPRRLMAERRLKHSPLRDVASMIYSIHSASWSGMARWSEQPQPGVPSARLQEWSRYWAQQVAASFLRGYLGAAAGAEYLPRNPEELLVLLDTLLLDRFLCEVERAAYTQPRWLAGSIDATLQVLELREPVAAAPGSHL